MTDKQWQKVGREFAPPKPRPRRKSARRGGRPRLPDRVCFDAMIWTFFHGRGEDLPKTLGTSRTLRARVKQWQRERRMTWAWYAYLDTLPNERRRELSAALSRHREDLGWRSQLRYLLEMQYGARMAAAARPPNTDKPLDPELEKLMDEIFPSSRK